MRAAWVVAGELLCVLPGAALRAAEEPLPAITVTESRPAPDLSTVVIEEIDSAASPALTELLRLVPGLHLDRMGFGGGVSSLYLRGGDPNHTAVFLDGVKLNDPTNTRGGSVDFSLLQIEDLERIEVLRGPGSALRGTDAMAGALNLVSAQGDHPSRLLLRAAHGDRESRHGYAGYRGARDALDYAAGAAYNDSGEAIEGSSARAGALSFNLGYSPDAASEARAILRYTDSRHEVFPEDSGGPLFAERRERERRDANEWVSGLNYRFLSRRGLGYRARLGFYRRDEDLRSPGVPPGARDPFGIPASFSRNRFERYELGMTAESALAGIPLMAGVQGMREDGDSDATLEGLGPAGFRMQRDSAGIFLDADDRLGERLRVEASLRADAAEGFAPAVTPRLRLSYPLGETLLAASAGRGYKLPSFFALAHPIVGNPDLKPEKSRGYELSATHAFGLHTLSAAVFHTRYTDAIDFEEGPPPRLVNRDSVLAQGAELGWRLDFAARGHWRSHVAYVETDIENSRERLRNRPRWTGGTQLRWSPGSPIEFLASAFYVGGNLDSSIPTGDRELPPYWRLDLGAGWLPVNGVGLRLDFENALDERYEELVGFPGPRRSARLSLRLSL